MEFLKTGQTDNSKLKNAKEHEYNFEKEKNDALRQFEKLYSNSKNDTPPKKDKQNVKKHAPKKIKAKFKKSLPQNFMNILFKDQDKTLIIILIVMLMDNEENLMIIMALIYLLV